MKQCEMKIVLGWLEGQYTNEIDHFKSEVKFRLRPTLKISFVLTICDFFLICFR